jgi:hypothetical protein
MKSAFIALALLGPSICVAADTVDANKAAEAILTACISSASTGAPVDTTSLLSYFKPDGKQKLTSLDQLPPMQLSLNNKGTFRCVLMGKEQVADTDFARAVSEKIKTWPRFEHKPLKSVQASYVARGDAQQGIHGVVVTVEITEMKIWEVMVWDTGLPK